MKNIFKLSAIAFLAMPVAANAFPVFIPGMMGVSVGMMGVSGGVVKSSSGGEGDGTGGVTTVLPPSSGDEFIADKPIDLMPLLPDDAIPFPRPTPPGEDPGVPGVPGAIGGYEPDPSSVGALKTSRR